jgi:ribosome-associated protein
LGKYDRFAPKGQLPKSPFGGRGKRGRFRKVLSERQMEEEQGKKIRILRIVWKEKQMESIQIRDEFIKLGQAMKLAGLVEEGVEAKLAIQNGEVTVNGEVDTRRGRKLYEGDVFAFDGNEVKVTK